MLQAMRDYHYVHAFDEAFGLRELRAKVNAKAGIKGQHPPNRLSIWAEQNYGIKSVEVVRKYLDTGVLLDHLNDKFWNGDRCWGGDDYYRFNVLAACVMTLGCTLPSEMRDCLEKQQHPKYQQLIKQSEFRLKPLARAQMKKAVATYKDGEPYDFGNSPTFLEASINMMFPGKTRITALGNSKLVEVTQTNGKVIPQIVGPPSDDEVGLKTVHANHLCAYCGAENRRDIRDGKNEALLHCGRCQDRKYCSKECQKKQWKQHKVICMRPLEQMKKFMDSIPLDLADEGDKLSTGMGGMMLF